MDTKPDFVIPQELLGKIANYLATQPWAQVNELLAGIQGCKPCNKGEKNES